MSKNLARRIWREIEFLAFDLERDLQTFELMSMSVNYVRFFFMAVVVIVCFKDFPGVE